VRAGPILVHNICRGCGSLWKSYGEMSTKNKYRNRQQKILGGRIWRGFCQRNSRLAFRDFYFGRGGVAAAKSRELYGD